MRFGKSDRVSIAEVVTSQGFDERNPKGARERVKGGKGKGKGRSGSVAGLEVI
jgi:hypothetical protein